MNISIRRNHGVFYAESRLWYVHIAKVERNLCTTYKSYSHRACYLAVILYICGYVVLGASLQKHLSAGALIMGWGISEVATMINTVAVCEHSLDDLDFSVIILDIDSFDQMPTAMIVSRSIMERLVP